MSAPARYTVTYREGAEHSARPWQCIAPDGSLVGAYATEERAERERYAREIRAQGIARRAREAAAREPQP